MIVQPDFPRHYKTRKLITITGDQSSPLVVAKTSAWQLPGGGLLKKMDVIQVVIDEENVFVGYVRLHRTLLLSEL